MRVNRFGWIKLYRQLLLSDLWQDRPFAKGQAWVDLLLLYDKAHDHLVISKRELSRRWGWSVTKVTHFLADAQENHDLKQFAEQKKTIIQIDKYKFFQEVAYQKKTPVASIPAHSPGSFKKKKEKKEVSVSAQALLDFWEKQR